MRDATTGGGPIPASVAESVQARVAALPVAARRLVEIAAVAGRVVPGALLLVMIAPPGGGDPRRARGARACGAARRGRRGDLPLYT